MWSAITFCWHDFSGKRIMKLETYALHKPTKNTISQLQGTVFKRTARLKSPKSACLNERDGGWSELLATLSLTYQQYKEFLVCTWRHGSHVGGQELNKKTLFSFSCKFFEKKYHCFDPKHGHLFKSLQTKSGNKTEGVSHQDLVPEATASDGCLLTQPRRQNNQ